MASTTTQSITRSLRTLAATFVFAGLTCSGIADEPAKPAPSKPESPKAPAPEVKPEKPAAKDAAPAAKESKGVLELTLKDIDGKDVALSQYKGKVVMIVNVATQCGLTPQYEGLQKLHDTYKDKGFVVLGFPCNDFGGQEPGTEAEIKEFCTGKYHVTFPMFSKVVSKTDARTEPYKTLVNLAAPLGGDLKWNFTKFVVDRHGKVAARFEPKTAPMDASVTKKIEELLAQKVVEEKATKPGEEKKTEKPGTK